MSVFSLGRFWQRGMSVDTFDMDSLTGLTDYIEGIKWLLYPFTFLMLFVDNNAYFCTNCLYALAGLFILKAMKRRGEYRHIGEQLPLRSLGLRYFRC